MNFYSKAFPGLGGAFLFRNFNLGLKLPFYYVVRTGNRDLSWRPPVKIRRGLFPNAHLIATRYLLKEDDGTCHLSRPVYPLQLTNIGTFRLLPILLGSSFC